DATEACPEEPMGGGQPRSLHRALQDSQLVTARTSSCRAARLRNISMTDAMKAQNTLPNDRRWRNHNRQSINQIWICGNHRSAIAAFVRGAVRVVIALAIGALAWLYRFNDPYHSYAGLPDDQFFSVIRGWQILFGELPTRDFVDPGAPLTFLIEAVTQRLGGRGTLSEMMFSVSALSVGATATFLLATHVSRSVTLGTASVPLQVALMTRLYNYPKILVYAAAIPLLWAFATKPSAWRRGALALVTAIAFLLRYDHGVFVALAVIALLALMTDVPIRERVRHGLIYSGLVVLLLSPYLVYVQANGGLAFQFQTANSWSQRDR